MNKIQQLHSSHGDKLFFLIPLRPLRFLPVIGGAYTDSSDEVPILCQIDESGRYKVDGNYKVTLKPIAPYDNSFETRHFYQDDLTSLIERGTVQVLIKE